MSAWRFSGRVALAIVAALVAAPAPANVTLAGAQHIGDAENASFTPKDPVTRAQMAANPTHFYLSQSTTVTAVQLTNPNNLDDKLQVFIDDMATPLAGTRSGSCDDGGTCTYTLATSVTLNPGAHTIWPDGGCSTGSYAIPCGAGGENDFAFDAIVLVSSQATTAASYHRRQHLGDNNESNDDYAGLYPDARDGSPLSFTFSLGIARVLSEVRFYALRGVAAAPLSYGTVSVDGVGVGNLTADGSPFTLSTSVVLAAGSHTFSVAAGQATAADQDDVSWDDIVLVVINNPATTPGAFNAVDVGADAGAGQLTTKVAGSAFDVDLVAVTSGAQFTAYTGTVDVELLDGSNTTGSLLSGTNCDAGWVSLGTLASNVAFAAADAGRKTVSLSYAGALKEARLRITDSTLGVVGCSADNFAIRPSVFASITASHDSETSAGTTQALQTAGITSSSLPRHKAGQPFTIQATAYDALGAVTTGYDGDPVLSPVASVLGAATGAVSVGSWTGTNGTIRADDARYFEAGAVTLNLVDSTFAAVDNDDSTQAQREITGTFTVGRFVPDHFNFVPVVDAQFQAGCASTVSAFTYVGQPFNFTNASTAPPQARLVAVAADGTTTTTNYEGSLYKIHPGGGPLAGSIDTSVYSATTGTLDASVIPSPDNTFVNEGGGKSLYTLVPPATGYSFVRGAPVVPFDAQITIAPNFTEDDGVAIAAGPASGVGFGDPDGIPFAKNTTEDDAYREMRYGRLIVENAHGSENLDLAVPLRIEYWQALTGGNGFGQNLLDDCTPLATSNFTLGPPPASPVATSIFSLSVLSGGRYALTLTAPGVAGQTTVTGAIASDFPWLRTDADPADADTAYDDEPSGVATFGIASNNQRRIYQREVLR